MNDWTVKAEGVWRKFGLSVRSGLKYGLIDSARRFAGLNKDSERLRPGEFWALQDVNFELKAGDALGIMGVNGSGKTTLLRILNGTYSPDRGKVMMRGQVGSLIAAGAGFSPMLSGRENVYVNATLLGLAPSDIRLRFDEIVEFAGLGEFIDMPVRNYSSGMTVRLGFAIAIMCVPEILLVDEVLAVGDLAFQKRCYEKMQAVRSSGTTVILVSHTLSSVWSVCNCGLFLNKGISSGLISVEEVGRLYDLQNARVSALQAISSAERDRKHSAPIVRRNGDASSLASPVEDVATLPREYGGDQGGSGDAIVTAFRSCDATTWMEKVEFDFGESIGLEMTIHVVNRIPAAIFHYSIDAMHYKFVSNANSAYAEGMGLRDLEPGDYIVRTVIRDQRFCAGAYGINLSVSQKNVSVHVYFRNRAGAIVIRPPTDRFIYDSHSPAVVNFDAHFDISALTERLGFKHEDAVT